MRREMTGRLPNPPLHSVGGVGRRCATSRARRERQYRWADPENDLTPLLIHAQSSKSASSEHVGCDPRRRFSLGTLQGSLGPTAGAREVYGEKSEWIREAVAHVKEHMADDSA